MKRIYMIFCFLVLQACGNPYDKAAKPEQLKKFQKVLEMYPELRDDYEIAQSDGVITKGELLEIAEKAGEIKTLRDKK